jgi:uncharacterized protein
MSDLQNEQAWGANEVLAQVFQAFTTGNIKESVDLMAEDIVMEFPFAPPGRPRFVEGKENIIAYIKEVMSNSQGTGYTDIEIHQTTDPDCIIVEMIGHGTVTTTGNSFERRYIDVFRTKNGRIQYVRDYWNPQDSPTFKA